MLDKAEQAILMGPPGTSKSYMANLLSEKFTHTKRIQFHPQYSYQDFIGGKILDQGTLKDKKGEFIEFLDSAINNTINDTYLLVIEEINRANVSQVFGELIQLLDRNEKLNLSFNGIEYTYYLPDNLKIIGMMNTTDKVLIVGNAFSIADLLQKINSNLLNSLNNKEMVIGHAIFLKEFVKDATSSKYIWDLKDFVDLFNYVVLPIIEDYCNGNIELIKNILGEKLIEQLTGDDFVQAVQEFLSK